jgi:hypothetical protein
MLINLAEARTASVCKPAHLLALQEMERQVALEKEESAKKEAEALSHPKAKKKAEEKAKKAVKDEI